MNVLIAITISDKVFHYLFINLFYWGGGGRTQWIAKWGGAKVGQPPINPFRVQHGLLVSSYLVFIKAQRKYLWLLASLLPESVSFCMQK